MNPLGPIAAAVVGRTSSRAVARHLQRERLMSICGAAAVLDQDREAILRLVDGGELRWVWNIALSPEHARKLALRFLGRELQELRAGRKCSLRPPMC